MFEALTDRAHRVILLARNEALALEHAQIGTEHILLGLLREQDGLAARVLESLDITFIRVHGHIVRIMGAGHQVLALEEISFSPTAKHALRGAKHEAQSLGLDYVDTEHLLLGLLDVRKGHAARILQDMGVDTEALRHVVTGMQAEGLGPEAG